VKIVVTVGMPGSGKSSHAKSIGKKYGFPQLETGNVLLKEMREKNIEITSDNIKKYTGEMKKISDSYFTKRLIEIVKAEHKDKPLVFLSGMRAPSEIQLLRKEFGGDNVLVVAFLASRYSRFKRISQPKEGFDFVGESIRDSEKEVEEKKKEDQLLTKKDELVKKDEKALYDLLRLNQYVDNPIGLVMISNYRDIFINVEPRIKSSLNIEGVEFKSYSLQEMKDILMERCKHAFRSGVLQEGVIHICANHAVNKSGDVRVGLECLRRAARICEEEGSDKITVNHVKKVLKGVGPVKLNLMKENLEGVKKNIVELLSGEKQITSTELYRKYVKKFGKMSRQAFRKHVKHLEDIGMLRVKMDRKETRGRKYFISLVKRKVFK